MLLSRKCKCDFVSFLCFICSFSKTSTHGCFNQRDRGHKQIFKTSAQPQSEGCNRLKPFSIKNDSRRNIRLTSSCPGPGPEQVHSSQMTIPGDSYDKGAPPTPLLSLCPTIYITQAPCLRPQTETKCQEQEVSLLAEAENYPMGINLPSDRELCGR